MDLLRYAWLFVRTGAVPWVEDRLQQAVVHWRQFGRGYRVLVLMCVMSGSLVFLISWYRLQRETRRVPRALRSVEDERALASQNDDGAGNAVFDACVVGGGPAGAACAYYLASAGMRVLMLEKGRFPRDKVCGDVVIPAVQAVLKEMGVWQRIMESGAFRWINSVALVGADASVMGTLRAHRPMTIQRYVLDQELAIAARQAGAHVAENHCVESATLQDGVWTVHCAGQVQYQCTVLVCADGADSQLARQLGVIDTAPNAKGERVFLGPEFGAKISCDCVMQMDGRALRSVVREVDDYLCQTNYHQLASHDDGVGGADDRGSGGGFVFSDAAFASARVDSCAMRVGGVDKAYGNQLLVVGDAAGLGDPLTGYGICNALRSGRAASRTIVEALAYGDVSASSLGRYQSRIASFTRVEFGIASAMAKTLRVYPKLAAAAVAVLRSRGVLFFSEWVGALQGDKRMFISVSVALLIVMEAARMEVVNVIWPQSSPATAGTAAP